MSSGVTAGLNISYDKAFDTRVSSDLKVRFGGASTATKRKAVQQLPVINALTSTPSNRDVRVHDLQLPWGFYWCDYNDQQGGFACGATTYERVPSRVGGPPEGGDAPSTPTINITRKNYLTL